MVAPSGFPGVEGWDTGGDEIGSVAGNNGHFVDKGGGRDVRVALRSRIGHMQGGTSPCDLKIDCENPPGEPGDNLPLNPNAQNLSLDWIAPIDLQHAKLEFEDADYGQIQGVGRNTPCPAKDSAVCWTRFRFTEFRYDICVEQIHQVRSISLAMLPRRGGSKSNFGVSSGILKSSTISFSLPASL